MNEEAIEYLKNYKYDNEVRQAIDTVLAYIEELENKLKIQTENYNSAYEDINWLCGKRNGKTVELALILRKEILKLPEGRTYGIRRCKNNIICVIPEEVTLNSKIRDKIEVLEKLQKEFPNNDGLRIKIIAYKELLEEEK